MSALSAFKVLELSESVAGEYCGKLLSDFGAKSSSWKSPAAAVRRGDWVPLQGRRCER